MESYINTTSLVPVTNTNNPPILAAAAAVPPLPPLQPRFIGLISPAQQIELLATALLSFTLALCVGLILPCCACVALHRIFTQIADRALTVWARDYPPRNQVVLEAGSLRLEFGCAMLEPVPWEFVAEMAISGREAVERGFMPFFERQWWWVKRNGATGGGERMCYVGIRVVERGRVVVPPEF